MEPLQPDAYLIGGSRFRRRGLAAATSEWTLMNHRPQPRQALPPSPRTARRRPRDRPNEPSPHRPRRHRSADPAPTATRPAPASHTT